MMTTPPNDPYGQPTPAQPDPAAPYGQPAAPQYGQPAYGAPGGPAYGAPFTPGQQPEPSKTMAIAALVLSLIACAIPNLISLVLAIIVLAKKKGGKGLAIAAIIIDVIVLIVWVALFAGGAWLFSNVVTVENAEVGQCVSTSVDSDTVGLLKQDCSKAHEAEVVAVGDLTADEITLYEADDLGTICAQRVIADDRDPGELPGDTVNILTGDLTPAAGDAFVCLVENTDGSKLDAK